MLRFLAVLLFLTLLAPARAATDSVVMPRYPALSPDGKTLVFSYQGDLWTSPVDASSPARRLTVHPAYESRAAFSPDGRQIAFNSSRYGSVDAFVMPTGGGEPRRLTFYSGGSVVQGWAGNGKILLTSSRELQRSGPAFYTIGAGEKPGRPKPMLAIGHLYGGQLSPDGTKLVFVRGSTDWPRKGYHGAANADVWTYTIASKQFAQLTKFDGEDLWPQWLPNGVGIVYVSEQDGTYNLWRMASDGAQKTQITHYKGEGVRFPSVAANGKIAAFEIGDKIAIVSLTGESATPQTVALQVAADDKTNPTDVVNLTAQATEMAPSPDGEQIAFVVRGDIFVVGASGGKATRLTDAPARDGDLTWSPDGKTLVFVSNRDGNPELYAISSTDSDEPRLSRSLKRKETRLTTTPEAESGPQFAPDGKKLAFIRGKGNLMVADPDAKNAKAVLTGTRTPDFRWSPDGRWFALAMDDEEFNSDIYLMPSDGSKKPANVSMHPANDYSPTWSPDGTKLFWSADRSENGSDLYFVYLKKEDEERTADSWTRQRELRARPAPAPPAVSPTPGTAPTPGTPAPVAPPATGAAPAAEPPAVASGRRTSAAAVGQAARGVNTPISIDLAEIDQRQHRLTTLLGSETGPVAASGPDGHTQLAFRASASGTSEVYLIDFQDGSDTPPTPRRLTVGASPGGMVWSRDGKTLFFLRGEGTLASLSPADAPGAGRPIPFRARLSYNRRALQAATYEEAWQTLDDEFYDPKFHGADWAAIRAKYRPMAVAASDPSDFYDVIRLMMGNLNSSHIGITPARADDAIPALQTGALGVVWDESFAGPGLKIKRVIKGSPADLTATKLTPGEVVTSIAGTILTAETNPDELLSDTVGERTPLGVTGTDGKTREVILQPVASATISALLYDEWVDSRKTLTHKLSDGKLAYLHIRSMDRASQDQFEQGLYAEAHGRDGLLIDVRDNGGGSTADYLLTILTIPRHAYTIPRDGVPGYPQDRLPLYPWQKPAALMANEWSYSNAEIFAHAFKTIKRGPLVGVPTFGAVISTGARQLLDGSTIRTPGRGWYNVNTGINEEHTAAKPDVIVENTPADELAGRDPQLEAAVKTLLAKAKPIPLPTPQAAK